MKRFAGFLSMATLLAILLPGSAGAGDWEQYRLRIKAHGHWFELSYSDLQALSATTRTSMRGTKERQVIPLETLLVEGAEVTLGNVERLVFVSEKRSLLLEGAYLEQIPNMKLKLGNIRPSILPEDDATWQALQPEFGRDRFKDVETIYVWEAQSKAGDKKSGGQGGGSGGGKNRKQGKKTEGGL